MTFVPTLTLNPTVDNSALIDRVVADTERLFRNIKNK